MKLSAVEVRNATTKNNAYKLPDGKGLYLHISPSGKKHGVTGIDFQVKNPLLYLENIRLSPLKQLEKLGLKQGDY